MNRHLNLICLALSFTLPSVGHELNAFARRCYRDDSVYRFTLCPITAANIVQKIGRNSRLIHETDVIFILYEMELFNQSTWKPTRHLHPEGTRKGIKAWNYHVVVNAKGGIIDPDVSAKAVPPLDYFENL